MLTRIRNASRARHDKVVVPTSKLKVAVARVLREAGYIADFVEHDLQPQGEITLQLKYGPDKSPVITGIKRISKPGLRRYVPVRDIRPVLNGMGISILSTSRGVLSDAEARKQNIGGELICTVY
jgi:small subunit ribosomal protein S8